MTLDELPKHMQTAKRKEEARKLWNTRHPAPVEALDEKTIIQMANLMQSDFEEWSGSKPQWQEGIPFHKSDWKYIMQTAIYLLSKHFAQPKRLSKESLEIIKTMQKQYEKQGSYSQSEVLKAVIDAQGEGK